MSDKNKFDVVVVGTGAGGGIAIKTLAEAGYKVCAINGGQALDKSKHYRLHRKPYDMPFRGFNNPETAKNACGFMDNEYALGLWEREIPYTTGPGTVFKWPRLFLLGGKTNFWGRSSARFGDIDFRAKTIDGGADVDWPVTYEEIAPFYSRVERLMGVASTVQGRPSNPDGEYLPPFKFRCMDKIMEAGCKKVGIPYLPDRIAQLTQDHNGFPKCHFCANCSNGCDVGSTFSTPARILPAAMATGNVDLRVNALAKNVIVDENGRAKGVAYIDRKTKKEIQVFGRAVILAAGCLETTKIMLNSKSKHWPNGIANSSGQLGRNLTDQLYGTTVWGVMPQLHGTAPFPDNVSDNTIAWVPRWQNLKRPDEEKFVRGYSMYVGGGASEFPWYHEDIDGIGSSFKRAMKDYYPTPVNFYTQAPSLPHSENYMDIDPVVKDPYGIPVARFHFRWHDNELKMFEHGLESSKKIFAAAGVKLLGTGQPDPGGTSLHETGTARMGNDPKKFVTNKWGATHDVNNLYVNDASIFVNSTDKSTTISIVTFSLRGTEHLIEQMKKGVI